MTFRHTRENHMLTPKDVLYLEDVLDQSLVLNKRISQELSLIQNKEVKSCFEDVQKQLKEHYKTLLQILESEAK